MKKIFLLSFIALACSHCFSQYIGVRARYVETKLVDNPPHAPSRENRLILSFFTVDAFGVYTPANLTTTMYGSIKMVKYTDRDADISLTPAVTIMPGIIILLPKLLLTIILIIPTGSNAIPISPHITY